jgi:fatty-acyl-CoA synthase
MPINPLRAFHPRTVAANFRRAKAGYDVVRFDASAEMSLAACIAEHASQRPERLALRFEGQTWTYAELDREIEARADVLHARGLRQGQTVALMMSNRPAYFVNLFALNRLGVAGALINTSLRGNALRHAVRIASPVALLFGAEHEEACVSAHAEDGGFGEVALLRDTEPGAESGRADGPRAARFVDAVELTGATAAPRDQVVAVRGTDLFAYIYTSGTTGLPKAGRILNARAILAARGFGGIVLAMSPRDTMYVCLPLFHSNGLLVSSASAFGNGATVALARRFSASRFWDDIRESASTVFCYIGEICRYLCAQPPRPDDRDHGLRAIVGNGLRPEVWRELVDRFAPGTVHEFYGATEGNVIIFNVFGKFGSVGRMPPLPSLDNALLVRFDQEREEPVRDSAGRCVPCGAGEVGELLGRINNKVVSQRFDGYADEQATQKKILRDVLEPGDAWFRTGDLLRKDRLGFFYFVDRIGDTFRWKGENVATNEVADALTRFAAIHIANVYGVSVPHAEGKAGMATLVLRDGATLDPAALYEHVCTELPAYARPAFLRLAADALLTQTFKLQKVDLAREGYDFDLVADPLYVRDDAGRTYRRLDATLLGALERGDLAL